ncbi:MAG: phospholipase A [Epsilonproteobacteria bacterium]|nr:phospholipase A [Campylobacterota bacterium]
MRFLLLISLIYFYANGASINYKLEKARKEMIKSLDLNGTSKDTISEIVTSSFNLKAYKENYLLPASYRYNSDFVENGTHDSKHVETEYQVSIKYDFASDMLGLGEIYSFGYTQRSWWQVYAQSAFFRESNYQPEFFVKIPTYKFLGKTFVKGFKLSAIHESNGRGGEYERSWNRLSLSTFTQYKNLISEFEVWYRLPDNIDYNPNITDYLGYGQLKLLIPYNKNLFKVKIRTNDNLEKGSLEFTYTHPLPTREESDLFLFVKTFNGYGESLIDYNHYVNKISIGVGISR